MKEQEKTTERQGGELSRRDFMGAAAAVAAFTIVPRHVLGGTGHTPPSEKLNIACIGVGGMGAIDLKNVSGENIVALCDVDEDYAGKTFELYPKAKKYRDFRKMLEKEKDIEAVMIATPDHTHAVIAMTAIKMGKHVYCQKPLTHSVYEARKLAEAAREAKVATQMGNQGHSGEAIRLICEWIWDGAIGPVREVQAWSQMPVWPQGMDRPEQTPPVPSTLDWDLWLGPAPYRPYHPCYVPFNWRGWWDFGTGTLGDQVCHILDPAYWALKLGCPVNVEASGSKYVRRMWDKSPNTETYPRASVAHYRFGARDGMPPVKLTWYDGGLMPERPEELEAGRRMGDYIGGLLFIGDKGKLISGCFGEGARLIPESRMREYEQPPKTIPRSIGHYKEWVQACKTGSPTGSNFDYAAGLTEIALLGNIALRTGRQLHWDGPNMKITNVDEANLYLRRKYRDGWAL